MSVKCQADSKFIISKTNRDAARHCFSLAMQEGAQGSITFIYGKSPCGKTLLLNETARIYKQNVGEKVKTVTGSELAEQYIKMLKNQDMHDLADSYASTKLLLVDELQSCRSMGALQSELSGFFSTISDRGTTVILFSGPGLQAYEELKLRLSNEPGFCSIEIGKADISLRKAILQRYLDSQNVRISPRAFRRIVLNRRVEVSAIEGFVLKLKLMQTLQKSSLSDLQVFRVMTEYA